MLSKTEMTEDVSGTYTEANRLKQGLWIMRLVKKRFAKDEFLRVRKLN